MAHYDTWRLNLIDEETFIFPNKSKGRAKVIWIHNTNNQTSQTDKKHESKQKMETTFKITILKLGFLLANNNILHK